jgi:hypothetical protein
MTEAPVAGALPRVTDRAGKLTQVIDYLRQLSCTPNEVAEVP